MDCKKHGVAHEIVHQIKKHKGKKGLLLMKINLKKAYDRLEWSFLKAVMQALGFNEKFRDLLHSCIRTVVSSILLNGNVT